MHTHINSKSMQLTISCFHQSQTQVPACCMLLHEIKKGTNPSFSQFKALSWQQWVLRPTWILIAQSASLLSSPTRVSAPAPHASGKQLLGLRGGWEKDASNHRKTNFSPTTPDLALDPGKSSTQSSQRQAPRWASLLVWATTSSNKQAGAKWNSMKTCVKLQQRLMPKLSTSALQVLPSDQSLITSNQHKGNTRCT